MLADHLGEVRLVAHLKLYKRDCRPEVLVKSERLQILEAFEVASTNSDYDKGAR